MGHVSIVETEGTYGHLVHERHERDVDHLDAVLSRQRVGRRRRSARVQRLRASRRILRAHLRLLDR
jgi:hypothetical protein